ncbi:hypothetical protein O9K51_11387 [Purpureocillium lavendulum]|uniref:Uncharacterized protein n=1 Tax=Purpureocillium lavendulum TaxID=1247861 RepID=A0AB34FAG3_9HYPO|nr:hypothetical protein O9K51_11387 [Purpureocillium lavendulum]
MSEFNVTIVCPLEDLESVAGELHKRLEAEGYKREYYEPAFAVLFRFTRNEVEEGFALPRGCAILGDQLYGQGYELKGNPLSNRGRVFVKGREPV